MEAWSVSLPSSSAARAVLLSDLRPRSASEILDAAIEIYRRYFATFLAISIVAAIPAAVAVYFNVYAQVSQQPADMLTATFIRILGLAMVPFADGAIAYTATAAYFGGVVDLEQSVRLAFSRGGRLFAAVLVRGILLVLGIVFFIVPGLIVFKRYFAIPMTVLFEDNTVGDAIARSRSLSGGAGKRIFGLLGGVLVFTFSINALLASLAAAAFGGAVAMATEAFLVAAVASPLSTLVATLLYYDIRIRREGYDIELMARALGTTLPPRQPHLPQIQLSQPQSLTP